MSSGAEKIVSSIMSEAQAKADAIIQEAEKEAAGILEEGEKRARMASERILESARKQADMRYQQIISEAKMNARRAELEAREEVIQEAFRKAEEELQNLASSSSDEYVSALKAMIKEAAVEIGGGELTVSMKEGDDSLDLGLDKIAAEVEAETGKKTTLEVGDSIRTIGGAVVRTKDGLVEVNNTVEARMSRFKKALRSEVAKVLFQ
ncbi:V-type proton ATPase subunit E [Methanothermobacter sp.]|uniref:V-type proton ATPase subunit E n=1 Tax=Methanothermobacter sp. TaxID=1884223 RepID=UPI002603E770|nr:V-type proton ATPase subunit E [Methanothermobacter sp.]MDI9618116.1 V-type proton ATPase subunit E [Methanothermobacter sp.]